MAELQVRTRTPAGHNDRIWFHLYSGDINGALIASWLWIAPRGWKRAN